MGGKGRGKEKKRKKGGRKGREKGREGEGREGGKVASWLWGMDAPENAKLKCSEISTSQNREIKMQQKYNVLQYTTQFSYL